LNKRHAVGLPPLNSLLAQDLVERSGLVPLLRAWRSRPAADEPAVIATLLKVSRMACDLRDVAELDINPLLVGEHGVIALDARVRLHPQMQSMQAQLAIRPYPQELEESLQMGGKTFLLRPIRPEDGERLRAFYQGATPADMRLRFFMSRREVPTSELARYSQIDYDREMTFVALAATDEGQQQVVGEARAVCDPDNVTAEFALQVASGWQGQGLGRKLLQKLVGYLRQRGVKEIVGQCLQENRRMATLAGDLGFDVRPQASQEVLSMRLPLQGANPSGETGT
jgi:acetyltransferase